MRKFWKLGLIVGIVAFMAGCSNLWDYVPPPRVNNNPPTGGSSSGGGGKPSSGGGSGSTRNVLTFYVNDGSGTPKPVTVTPDPGKTEVSLSEIQQAYKDKYGDPSSNSPSGFKPTGDWLNSNNTTVSISDNISGGSTLLIGFAPDTSPISTTNGYTVTLSTGSAGGNRKFPTTPEAEGDKSLSAILSAAGLTGPDYKPANPKTGWTFDHWEKVGSPNTTINPSDTTIYPSGTNFVAVYNVDYTIKIDGTDYPIKVPVTAPNEGATLEDILKAAANDPNVPINDVDALKKMLWEAGSSVADTDSTKRYPANTIFTGTNAISFNVGGKNVKVPVGAGETSATWEKIAAAAKRDGINVDKPAVPSALTGGVFAEWQTGDAKAEELTSYPANSVFKPAFEVSYSISDGYTSYQHKEKVLEGTNTKKKLSDIFNLVNTDNSNAVPSDGSTVKAKIISPTEKVAFDGWRVTTPDGVTKIIRSSEIAGMTASNFPAGTKIKPNGIYQLFVDKGWDTNGLSMDFTYFAGGQGGNEFSKVGDFYIANTEVTREQWKKVMSKGGDANTWLHENIGDQYDRDGNKTGTSEQWKTAITASSDTLADYKGKKPMDRISWYDAIMFCNKLSLCNDRTPYYYFEYEEGGQTKTYDKFDGGDFDFFKKLNELYTPTFGRASYHDPIWMKIKVKTKEDLKKPGFRLPKEDYWKYAAHGGKMENGKWLYPTFSGTTGSDLSAAKSVAWFKDNGGDSNEQVHEVGTKGGDNPIRDMSGNVWEWTETEYDSGTRLYIGGPYDGGLQHQKIENKEAMFSDPPSNRHAGKTGDRSTMGMRIIVYGTTSENYEDYFN